MKSHVGRLFGAILLIAGTTIGAGVLALPVATGRAGFMPSVLTMIFCWLYLTYSAFCLLEVNLSSGSKGHNIITMATHTLGMPGKVISWVAYLFLLYALNTAYIAISTTIFQHIVARFTGYAIAQIICVMPLLFIFGLLLRKGMQVIDQINRLMMIGLVVTFIALLAIAFPNVEPKYLESIHFQYIISSLSTIVTAFGFHVIIPSLSNYLEGNVKELKKAIWFGSLIPLIAYILWQAAILGLIPIESIMQAHGAGQSGSDLLAVSSKNHWTYLIAQAFALFVILTSFLGVSVSLFDFLADGLNISKKQENKWQIFFLTFVPPLYFALSYPVAFFRALEYAGAFGVVVLLALLPACMVWCKRYKLHLRSAYEVGGGKVGLAICIAVSLVIIVFEILLKLGCVE